MAAPVAKLGLLHELFTEFQIALLTRTDTDEEGNEFKIFPSAAEMAVIRAFLKDNNVQADPDASNDLKEVAGFARAALKDAGIDSAEMDSIVRDFENFSSVRIQ